MKTTIPPRHLPKPIRKTLMDLECAIASGEPEEIDLAMEAVREKFHRACSAIQFYHGLIEQIRDRLRWMKKRREPGTRNAAKELLELLG